MSYDEVLADRIRAILDGEPEITEKKMFGGLAFLTAGRMAVAAAGEGGLMLRIDPTHAPALLDIDGIEPMEMRGTPLNGWLYADADAIADDETLESYVQISLDFAASLPPKRPKRSG